MDATEFERNPEPDIPSDYSDGFRRRRYSAPPPSASASVSKHLKTMLAWPEDMKLGPRANNAQQIAYNLVQRAKKHDKSAQQVMNRTDGLPGTGNPIEGFDLSQLEPHEQTAFLAIVAKLAGLRPGGVP